MVSVEKVFDKLISGGVRFFSGVPDSLLKDFCAYVTDCTAPEENIIAANEGNAIGLAAGFYLASGKIPLVYMQNSGLGNSVNPLLSLVDEKVYNLPLLMMIGWRGEPGIKDEPQHIKQGEVTLDLLEAMNISYVIVSDNEEEALLQLDKAINYVSSNNLPFALVIRKNVFSEYKLKTEIDNNYDLSREEALKIVINNLNTTDIVVSTTGKLSRELFEYREFLNQNHEKDFLTVGSMGHSSSIALGIALQRKDRQVYCLDGDGAFIMHMGAITNIGNLSPKNYTHIVFNNGSHESVGKQPTLGFCIDIPEIALASGYKKVITATTECEIKDAIECFRENGPGLLEIKINLHSRNDLGRPSVTPLANRNEFMRFVLGEKNE